MLDLWIPGPSEPTTVAKRTLGGGQPWTCVLGPKWKICHPRARVEHTMWTCSPLSEPALWKHGQKEEAIGQSCFTILPIVEWFYGLEYTLPKALTFMLLHCLDYGFQFGKFIFRGTTTIYSGGISLRKLIVRIRQDMPLGFSLLLVYGVNSCFSSS